MRGPGPRRTASRRFCPPALRVRFNRRFVARHRPIFHRATMHDHQKPGLKRRLRLLGIVSVPGLVLAGLLLWKSGHVGIGPTLVHAGVMIIIGPVVFLLLTWGRRGKAEGARDRSGFFVLTPAPATWILLALFFLVSLASGYDTFVAHPLWKPSPIDRSGSPVAFVLFAACFLVNLRAAAARVAWNDDVVERRLFGRLQVRYRWDEIELAGFERWTRHAWLGTVGGRRLRISPDTNGFRQFNEAVDAKLGRLRPVGPDGLPPRRSHDRDGAEPPNPA